MSLPDTQREFLRAILAPEAPGDPRMAVYHRAVRGGHEGALAAAYPVVRRLVGAAWFAEAAARYAEAYPSRSGDLHAHGNFLAAFLERYPYARDLRYLPDVARLEWAVSECRAAADGEPLDYATLGAVPPESLGRVRMRLLPHVRRVASPHPVLAIWEANQPDRDGTPARLEGPERVLVRRRGFEVVPVTVGPGEWALAEAFSGGEDLDRAAARCERAGAGFDEALRGLAALEVLGAFELPSA